MCRSLKGRRLSFSGLKMKQEILYSLFDHMIHLEGDIDMVELLISLHPKVMLGLPMLKGTNPASCFPKIAIGYEASCYSSLWSQVLFHILPPSRLLSMLVCFIYSLNLLMHASRFSATIYLPQSSVMIFSTTMQACNLGMRYLLQEDLRTPWKYCQNI